MRVARLHRRIANIRRDWTHKLTSAWYEQQGLASLLPCVGPDPRDSRGTAPAATPAQVPVGWLRQRRRHKSAHVDVHARRGRGVRLADRAAMGLAALLGPAQQPENRVGAPVAVCHDCRASLC